MYQLQHLRIKYINLFQRLSVEQRLYLGQIFFSMAIMWRLVGGWEREHFCFCFSLCSNSYMISYKERLFILCRTKQEEMFLVCIAVQNLSALQALQDMKGRIFLCDFTTLSIHFNCLKSLFPYPDPIKVWIAKKYGF